MTAAPLSETRAALALLLPAAVVAGFGLGLLALGFVRPTSQVALPPLPSAQPQIAGNDAADVQSPRTVHPIWGAAFGEPTPVATPQPPEPEPIQQPEFDEPDSYDTSMYVLRGLVQDENGGWGLLETDIGSMVVRPGDILEGGEEVLQITAEGIEIGIFDEVYLIGFDDDAERSLAEPARVPHLAVPEPTIPRQSPMPPWSDTPQRDAPPEPHGLGRIGR